MQRVVAMPVYRQPHLLALTLEKLEQSCSATARFGSKPEVHIYADTNSNLGDIEVVRDRYLPEAFIFHAQPHLKAPSGCWNILNAINHAGQYADEVYLVEEDVFVYPYYFEWHQSQTAPVSCGRKLPRFELYTNPGTCFRRPLLDALRPHVCDEYFRDTTAYCQRFSEAHLSTLDDGLIRRLIMVNNFEVVFPPSPVCAHSGIRGMGLPGTGQFDIYTVEGDTLEKRIEATRKIVAAPKDQKRYAPEWEPYEPTTLPSAERCCLR